MGAVLASVGLSMVTVTGCADNGSGDTSRQSPPPGSAAGMDRYYAQKPGWHDCKDGFECATVKVPLDYARPQGQQLGLAVIRLPARKRSGRIGSLVTNPGGPGGSGVGFIREAGRLFGPDVRDRFDLVGFDPRGVGESEPVRCLDGPQLDRFFTTDTSPDDPREVAALSAQSQAFANGCKARSAARLPHVGTLNAARDIDVLRAALGDDKLTYMGFSYGTYLGAFYAEQFPRNVRALVLDGAVDPTLSSTATLLEQAKGFETALRAFVEDCAKAPDCPLGPDVDKALDRISDLQRQTDRTPLRSPRGDTRRINETWVTTGIAAALYNKGFWPTLRIALGNAIQKRDGDMLLTLADQMLQRRPDGSYSNQMEANMAVNCVDKPNPPNADAYGKEATRAAADAPHFGEYVIWGGLPCVYWPVQTRQAPRPLTADGAAPILVIGTTRDPATPYRWAQALATQLRSGTLLTHEGDGHTAYLGGPTCITAPTDRYLTKGTPPKEGTVCR
ncbi:alpha/beta hydrolase family protein [Thermomonospora umbrina]|uniref:Alpha/beta hydrolase family protein n=2 Tax=Thermomonospora umbrina TaxID=111806 RepID=A0A3D9SZB3_9ACTN|nr:alpha/beta hydrolase family protein [Thermomonospora umbrina]